MNRDTTLNSLPSLTADILSNPENKIDNLFSKVWQVLNVNWKRHNFSFKRL